MRIVNGCPSITHRNRHLLCVAKMNGVLQLVIKYTFLYVYSGKCIYARFAKNIVIY